MFDHLSQAAAVSFALQQGALFQTAIDECIRTHTQPLDMILDQRVLRYYHTLRDEHGLADAAADEELRIARGESFLIRANVYSVVSHHFLLANDTKTPQRLADDIFAEWDVAGFDAESGDDRYVASSVIKTVYCAAIAAAHEGNFEAVDRYLNDSLKSISSWEWTKFWETLGRVHIGYAKIRAGEKLTASEAPGNLLERLRGEALESFEQPKAPVVGEVANAIWTFGMVAMWNGVGEIADYLGKRSMVELVPNLRKAMVLRWEGHYARDESQSDSFRLAAQAIENGRGVVWPFYWDAHPYIF